MDTTHSGLRLGNRRLDIKQYNGLRKPPTAQEEIDGFPDQEEDVTKSSTLEVTEQETRPSISEVFDIVTPREQPNILHSESEPRSPSPAKRADSPGSILAPSPVLSERSQIQLNPSSIELINSTSAQRNPSCQLVP